MKNISRLTLAAALLLSPAISSAQEAPKGAPSPNQIVDSAAPEEWVKIAPSDLLVMDLEPDAAGNERRVIIQLMPAPFSQGWVNNIRKLAGAKFWDGTSINRVQDNYVVQWGDASEEKALPEDLEVVPESEYVVLLDTLFAENGDAADAANAFAEAAEAAGAAADAMKDGEEGEIITSHYGGWEGYYKGWNLGGDAENERIWPVHCYGMVGVGRGYSPDTGTGAELYTVIGHAPRHLDRNIALVGRIIEGMEHLSSLPRGKGVLGFYEDMNKRVPIKSIRLGSELAEFPPPTFEYLDTNSRTYRQYVGARENRRDPFFIVPAGGADICNIPVPVRRVAAD